MKSLSLALLGLVLINVPACFSEECFSQNLKPSYPCCKGTRIVYSDEDGDWGVENNKWCGIGNGPSKDDSCFSVPLGYKCCKGCKVVYTDDDGEWGVESGKWCGIKDSCAPVPVPVPVPVKENTDFDFSFLKLENNKKNMLYSPLSIKYALNMLQEGAVNNTYSEINKLIGNAELPVYPNIDKVLSLANGLFIRDTYYDLVEPEYIETLKEKYDAEVKKDEFKDANNANQWIEEKTLGIIKNMLSDDIVQNPLSVMLIINALAIDMGWVRPFDDNSTHGEKFFLDNGEEMTATMMSKKEYDKILAYYENDDITAITMDLKEYDDIQLEFMAIMPNGTLSDFVENVTKEQITKIDEDLISADNVDDGVILRIPKFKFNYDLDFKNDLIKLGLNDAFDEKNADFTKMADPEDPRDRLHVSEALHKADIEFSEEGIKAAAVTVFAMMAGSAMPRPTYPVVIVMNKPFMFIIRDKNTKDIWFTGTVYQPNSWEDDKADYEPSRDYFY